MHIVAERPPPRIVGRAAPRIWCLPQAATGAPPVMPGLNSGSRNAPNDGLLVRQQIPKRKGAAVIRTKRLVRTMEPATVDAALRGELQVTAGDMVSAV
jgi:hypothetical protein